MDHISLLLKVLQWLPIWPISQGSYNGLWGPPCYLSKLTYSSPLYFLVSRSCYPYCPSIKQEPMFLSCPKLCIYTHRHIQSGWCALCTNRCMVHSLSSNLDSGVTFLMRPTLITPSKNNPPQHTNFKPLSQTYLWFVFLHINPHLLCLFSLFLFVCKLHSKV